MGRGTFVPMKNECNIAILFALLFPGGKGIKSLPID